MAPLWSWLGLGVYLAALPVALAGHGDPIAQKYIIEFADSKTVRQRVNSVPSRLTNYTNSLVYIVVCQLPLYS